MARIEQNSDYIAHKDMASRHCVSSCVALGHWIEQNPGHIADKKISQFARI